MRRFSTRWKVTTPARLFVAGREGLLDGAKPRVLSVIPRRRRGWGWCTSDEHTRQFLESAEDAAARANPAIGWRPLRARDGNER